MYAPDEAGGEMGMDMVGVLRVNAYRFTYGLVILLLLLLLLLPYVLV